VCPSNFSALVPVEAKPTKTVENRCERFLHIPLLIGVIDTQDELAAMAARKQPIEKSGANTADMKESGRARSKPRAHHRKVE
jgi:hypothetical protein